MDISAREPTPGEALYRQWCGSEISDRARYFTRMNPADKRAWERLASEVVSDDVDYWRPGGAARLPCARRGLPARWRSCVRSCGSLSRRLAPHDRDHATTEDELFACRIIERLAVFQRTAAERTMGCPDGADR